MEIICIDSDYDPASKMVAEWRRSNSYIHIKNTGVHLSVYQGNTACRKYFAPALEKLDGGFLSGSGHGVYEEFLGNDRNPIFKIGQYDNLEVKGKIIHLLACSTAFMLGVDVVQNGCKAFFGYDIPFAFHKDFLDEFMRPGKVLDVSISNDNTVSYVHDTVLEEYDLMIKQLRSNNASIYIVADLMTDRDHFCSPIKNNQWGNPDTFLSQITAYDV